MRVILTQLTLDLGSGLANFPAIRDLVRGVAFQITTDDLLLLPELVAGEVPSKDYERAVAELAFELGCHVVGGSHYPAGADVRVNSGIVASPTGQVLTRYEKRNPWAIERSTGVQPGSSVGWFTCSGRQVVILVCADFWYAQIFATLPIQPDIVLVPSLSLSRKAKPDHPRALWQHMAVARAYEVGAFVGISDWAHPTEYGGVCSSGVAGFAAPNPSQEEPLYRSLRHQAAAEAFDLDFDQIDELRRDRQARDFYPIRRPSTP